MTTNGAVEEFVGWVTLENGTMVPSFKANGPRPLYIAYNVSPELAKTLRKTVNPGDKVVVFAEQASGAPCAMTMTKFEIPK